MPPVNIGEPARPPAQPDADTVGRAAIFEALSPADREALAMCFRGREGDPGASLFLVGEGSLVAVSRASGAPREIGRFRRGEVIGEGALVEVAPRPATVTAVGSRRRSESSGCRWWARW